MKFDPLIPAVFLERVNRFVCLVELNGKEEKVLIRNTGRLRELLRKGRTVYLRSKTGGKYAYEIILVELPHTFVCVDSHLPPKLLVEYLKEKNSPWRLESYKYEYALGSSRFDLLINRKIVVETKSVNLVRDRTALFPDAPTLRGRRHLEELIKFSTELEPAVVFVIQREDAEDFSPNWRTDPEFSGRLKEFEGRGFSVYAFGCRVSLQGIYIDREIPVKI